MENVQLGVKVYLKSIILIKIYIMNNIKHLQALHYITCLVGEGNNNQK